ncbi:MULTISPECIES: I78 family peptidase inhibitor [Pseudomonas]|jgi:hypothetical protein|uniref:Peptidase inhibitor I78 family protein n=1 Tax=Pseudomonas weihenstephanensis TaxID=1608994 RepID=A0ABS1ZC05_9PSED|nr:MULTISPECIES: I78 family peptidase inhibitor [Pseudomonas]KVV01508.1 Peptidase inhibitor I78 family protein [Pseudomonas sp. TAD18]KVV02866.1 Peptidase inhibitor I78 family protein [Pseudomonas sp. TAA207]MBM1193996.1 hypothetical protein [Pseudomonas weihenstephanensis]
MFNINAVTRLILATSLVLGACSMPAMAAQAGQCKAFTLNFVVAPEVTPALLEMLRKESGATLVRVEKPGDIFTQEVNPNRLRVIVDKNNILVRYLCG